MKYTASPGTGCRNGKSEGWSSGNSSRKARGLTTAPERLCSPRLSAFSSTPMFSIRHTAASFLIALDQAGQLDGAGQPRRPRAHDHHVHLDRLGAGRIAQDEAIERERRLMADREESWTRRDPRGEGARSQNIHAPFDGAPVTLARWTSIRRRATRGSGAAFALIGAVAVLAPFYLAREPRRYGRSRAIALDPHWIRALGGALALVGVAWSVWGLHRWGRASPLARSRCRVRRS